MKLKNTIVIKKMCVLYYGCKRMGGGGVGLGILGKEIRTKLEWKVAIAETVFEGLFSPFFQTEFGKKQVWQVGNSLGYLLKMLGNFLSNCIQYSREFILWPDSE